MQFRGIDHLKDLDCDGLLVVIGRVITIALKTVLYNKLLFLILKDRCIDNIIN